MQLPDTHFSLISANDVQAISKPFMELFDLTYFDYCRIYKDGKMSLLANDPYWVKHFFAANYPAGGEVRKQGIYMWPTHLPTEAITDARLHFNHDHGMTVIYEHDDHIEFFDCATAQSNEKIYYYYMNHFDVFERFLHYFKSQAAKIIHQSDHHQINLASQSERKEIDNHCVLTAKKWLNDAASSHHSLTQRQKECLIYFAQGMTMRQIAEKLSLSHRTVEHYIDAIKTKLSCSTRYELAEKARELKLS